jgi:shikimate dehydrogenase
VIRASTRICCVIGDPVAHSRSPAMHNAAYDALGLDRRYVAFRVAPAALARALHGLVALGIDGANVTIPHKQAAAALCDALSDEARVAGAANTLIPTAVGALDGHLTDGTGLVAALADVAPGAERGSALVLGAGGSARAAAAALAGSGFRVGLLARRRAAADELADELAPARAVEVLDALPEGALGTIVNCTPVGGLEGDLPLPAEAIGRAAALADFAYRADGQRTPAVAAAEAAGIPVVDGLELLVRQGALAFELMTGVEAPLDVMRAAARS